MAGQLPEQTLKEGRFKFMWKRKRRRNRFLVSIRAPLLDHFRNPKLLKRPPTEKLAATRHSATILHHPHSSPSINDAKM